MEKAESGNNKDINYKIVDHFSDLILKWTEGEWGSFDKWLLLLKNIMVYLSKNVPDMTEIEIIDNSTNIVVELAIILYNKHTSDLTEEQTIELKTGKLKMIVLSTFLIKHSNQNIVVIYQQKMLMIQHLPSRLQ